MICIFAQPFTHFALQSVSSIGQDLSQSLASLIWQSPLLIIYLIGMVVALTYWKRSRSTSIFSFLAFGGLFLTSLFVGPIRMYLISSRDHYSSSDLSLSGGLTLIGIIDIMIRVIAFVLILVAIFGGRTPAKQADFRTTRI